MKEKKWDQYMIPMLNDNELIHLGATEIGFEWANQSHDQYQKLMGEHLSPTHFSVMKLIWDQYVKTYN